MNFNFFNCFIQLFLIVLIKIQIMTNNSHQFLSILNSLFLFLLNFLMLFRRDLCHIIKVTLKDIANDSGVSVSSVSMILNKREGVSFPMKRLKRFCPLRKIGI